MKKFATFKYLSSFHEKAHACDCDRSVGIVYQPNHPSTSLTNTFDKFRLLPALPFFSLFFLSVLLFLPHTNTNTDENTNTNTITNTNTNGEKKTERNMRA